MPSSHDLPGPSADAPTAHPRRPGAVSRRVIQRFSVSSDGLVERRARDLLASEEPLEIVLSGTDAPEPIAVTMRTPGADFDLVAGFLFGEAIVTEREDLLAMRYCRGRSPGPTGRPAPAAGQLYNRVEVSLPRGEAVARARARRQLTTSSCGVCGMGSIESVLALACPIVEEGPTVDAELLLSLPPRLREAQSLFERTGGASCGRSLRPGGHAAVHPRGRRTS